MLLQLVPQLPFSGMVWMNVERVGTSIRKGYHITADGFLGGYGSLYSCSTCFSGQTLNPICIHCNLLPECSYLCGTDNSRSWSAGYGVLREANSLSCVSK